ncbi:MAG: phage/plasmid replication protein, II/X family [Acidovorax sp.]|uniref:phage/plasmid replication protein, II/X family n=1 Tax=Acidovorax sp. TaxID=1872122 RepID=UPI00391BF20F
MKLTKFKKSSRLKTAPAAATSAVRARHLKQTQPPEMPSVTLWNQLPVSSLPECMSKPLSQQVMVPKPLVPWKPFYSSLIDTVRMKLSITHPSLEELTADNPHVRRNGLMYLVTSPLTGAVARVISRDNGKTLLLECSPVKWLTGQNVVGVHSVHPACAAVVKEVCRLLHLRPKPIERALVDAGSFTLTRVDCAVHIDCGARERAKALMAALRHLLVGAVRDLSFYGTQTLYISQSSKRRSLKIYLKGEELDANPMPDCVYHRDGLVEKASSLVRLELVLRRDELIRLGLDEPHDWKSDTIEQQMKPWTDLLVRAEGCVPDVRNIEALTPALQHKLRAWLLGDTVAFVRGVSTETGRASRKTVLRVTGIDVNSHLQPDVQRSLLVSVRELFERGLGYCDHRHKWNALVAFAIDRN